MTENTAEREAAWTRQEQAVLRLLDDERRWMSAYEVAAYFRQRDGRKVAWALRRLGDRGEIQVMYGGVDVRHLYAHRAPSAAAGSAAQGNSDG